VVVNLVNTHFSFLAYKTFVKQGTAIHTSIFKEMSREDLIKDIAVCNVYFSKVAAASSRLGPINSTRLAVSSIYQGLLIISIT
jgi:hypothetical protein